ncbi:MAG: TonB-dependent receptor [Bacteroidetes bacterium]|nr:TonB-dependent receptor [Bacteroidota bacterium]
MKNLFLLLFAFVGFATFAQNQITGTVKDASTGELLQGASVYIPKLEKGTVTDQNGVFTLNNLPGGMVRLVISLLGFETYSTNVNLSNNTSDVSISLKPSVFEMNEVVVSTPFQKLQKENVMKIEKASVESLLQSGAPTLAESLTNIPGVSNFSTGISIGKPVIRGLSGNRIVVYTQGVRLENQQFGDEHGLGLGEGGFESVEVIKGPASLLYGSDALGGVLYFTPENFAPDNKISGDASVEYVSNTQGVKSNVGVKMSGETFKFLIRGSVASHADYETPDDGRVTNSRFNEQDLKTALGYNKNNFKTTLRYNFNRLRIGLPEEIGAQSKSKSIELPFQDIDNHVLSSQSALFLKNSHLELNLGYLYNHRKELEDSRTDPALGFQLTTFNYDLKYHLPKWGNFETIVGVQGMYQDNENFGEEQLVPDAITKDIGFVATSLYTFGQQALQFGIRVDNRNIRAEDKGEFGEEGFFENFDRSFTAFNASLGYKIAFAKNYLARLNVASGSRSPNLAELASNGVHEGTNRFEIGNVNLDKEQNIQVDLSLEFANQHFELTADGFFNRINDFIFVVPEDRFVGEEQVFNFAQEDANLYGGEIFLHLHPHPLDWLHLESGFELVLGKILGGDDLPLIPAKTISNTLRVEWKDVKLFKNFYAFAKHQYTFEQNKVSSFETPTADYNLVSAGLGAELNLKNNLIRWSVSATNLFDETYIPHLSRLKIDGIPNIGRNINLKIGYLF